MSNHNQFPPTQPQPEPAPGKPKRPKRFGWLAASLFTLGGLTLGGLVGGTSDPVPASAPTPTATATPPTPVTKNVPYSSVEELKDAAVAAGYPCPNWQKDAKPGPVHAKESGSCSDDDVFSIYSYGDNIIEQVKISKGLINMLVGPNWIINIPEEWRSRVQAAIGGRHWPESMENLPSDEPTTEAPKPKPAPAKPTYTKAQEQAIGSAKDYLEYSAFSRKGLIRQLSSDAGEGFAKKDAIFAVDHIKVNWNEQAAKSAKEYLDYSHFSRSGLIRQLESDAGEGFTHSQAVYGVNAAGL
jgi:hypothetical protein